MPGPSGLGRVDMLTSPVAAARPAVATGEWVKSKHMYLIRGSVVVNTSDEGLKKKKKN